MRTPAYLLLLLALSATSAAGQIFDVTFNELAPGLALTQPITQPLSDTVIASREPVRAVLELRASVSAKLGNQARRPGDPCAVHRAIESAGRLSAAQAPLFPEMPPQGPDRKRPSVRPEARVPAAAWARQRRAAAAPSQSVAALAPITSWTRPSYSPVEESCLQRSRSAAPAEPAVGAA